MINIVFRRAVWTLLVFCLSLSAIADSYHPHIVKSQVVVDDIMNRLRNLLDLPPSTLSSNV